MPNARGARSTVTEVADALRAARRITAICHRNPDADTLGAAIAVRLIGERLGAEAEVVSVDPPGLMFAFLPGIGDVRRRPALQPDLVVTCDAASIDRIGISGPVGGGWLGGARVLNLDHHVSNDLFGDLNLVDPSAAATCEVLAPVVPALGMDYDQQLATALLAGIIRDSHGFTEPSTSPRTLRIAADLVDAGASLSAIQRSTFGELALTTLTLWGRVLEGIGQAADGRIVWAVLTREMLEATGARQEEADGIVEFIAGARGADVALLCREIGPRETRISIRTTDPIHAAVIAGGLGGGGHARRAGCAIREPVDVALQLLLREVRAALPG